MKSFRAQPVGRFIAMHFFFVRIGRWVKNDTEKQENSTDRNTKAGKPKTTKYTHKEILAEPEKRRETKSNAECDLVLETDSGKPVKTAFSERKSESWVPQDGHQAILAEAYGD